MKEDITFREDLVATQPKYFRMLALLFTTAKKWKQSKCLSKDERISKRWYIHTNRILLSLKKKGHSDTCYNMNEPTGHQVK